MNPSKVYLINLLEIYSMISSRITVIIIIVDTIDTTNGRKFVILVDNIILIIPPNGSRRPGIHIIKNDLKVESLCFLNIRDIEKLSKKFCKIMAIDKVIAPVIFHVKL